MKSRSILVITFIMLTAIAFYGLESATNSASGAKKELSATTSATAPTGSAARPELTEEEAKAILESIQKPAGESSGSGRNGGETFATATTFFDWDIISGGYTDNGTTIGYADDYDASCGGGTSTSPDAVYRLLFSLPGELTDIDIEVCNADYDTKLIIYDQTFNVIACSEDFCGVDGYRSNVFNLDVVSISNAEDDIFIVVDGWGGEFGNYTLNVTESNPCGWSVPAGAIAENEPCGTEVNNGCNMASPAFTTVADGVVISSNCWADGDSRDTDWYELTMGAADTILMIISSPRGEMVYGLIDKTVPGSANCADITGFISPVAWLPSECSVDTMKLFLPAGTHWFFAGTSGFYGYPCTDIWGTNRHLDYWVSFEVCNETWYADADGDGFGDPSVTSSNCEQPAGYVTDNTDCDDTNPAINPGASETCNGLDDDCNTMADDGLTFTDWYPDSDGDGYGDDLASPTNACAQPGGMVADNTDCDDGDVAINPGATDIPGNGIDEDCSGSDAVPPVREVVLDHVDGLNGAGQLDINTPIVFHFRARYLPGDGIGLEAFQNGFRVYSPDGANWQPATSSSVNASWDTKFQILFHDSAGISGTNDDTVGFAGVNLFPPQVPDGFDEIVWTISTQVNAAQSGLTICVDSSGYPNSSTSEWGWFNDNQIQFPVGWNGPHCFTIVCCDLAGDFNDDGSVDVSDVSGPTSMVAFMFLGGPPPPCPAEGDFNGDGSQDVSDLSGPVSIVAFMFLGGPPPICGP